jgi:bifunctional DNA-binding transcriptional regulator/antitoxin component of YhaV-PrlF toxin-antitoxin module
MNATYSVKISSKNQVTFPVSFLKEMGWQSGQIINLTSSGGQVSLQSSTSIINKSRSRLQKYQKPNSTIQEAIESTRSNPKTPKFNYEK